MDDHHARTMRNWPRYAVALDLRLQGKTLREIATKLGVSKERARQLTKLGAQQLAFRVYKGVKRPDMRQWYYRP